MVQKVKESMVGIRYGRLVAIEFLPDKTEDSRYLFQCDCGNTVNILGRSVKFGATKSCGCLNLEKFQQRIFKHGHSANSKSSRTYSSWASMMRRCEWGGTPNYETYGAVGIRVAPEWHEFPKFLEDMGVRPEETSIDRIDNTKGYSKENCRWATNREQSTNRSNTIFVMYKGIKTKVADLVVELGIKHRSVIGKAHRLNGNYAEALKHFGVQDVSPCHANPNEGAP